MEMQWLHSNAIHSGEFFHGPFEITDYDDTLYFSESIGNTLFWINEYKILQKNLPMN